MEPYSIIMQVGHIDCAKDSRDILERTIGIPLNDSLTKVSSKKLVLHLLDEHHCDVTFTEELPGVQNNNNFILFHVRTFLTGDLAFLQPS
jgi:hypothetical protein